MVQAVGHLEAPPRTGAGRAEGRVSGSSPDHAARCAILTPSGALLARGRVADRSPQHVGEAYSLQLTDVAPPGALEALFHANQPEVVLRAGKDAELALRIDHITGPPAGRTYWLQTLGR